MNGLHELKEKLLRELEEYSQNGKYSREDVETIKYMASAVDHLCNVMDREESDYSSRYSSRNAYDNGTSREGRSYARKRDSMGRYARDGYARDGYAQDGYSMHDPRELVEELRGMMSDFPQNVQQDATRLIQKLEQM